MGLGTGFQDNGVTCKSPANQLSEFMDTIINNGLTIDHVWFDIDSTADTCNAWNLGAVANLKLANDWIYILRTNGPLFGIHANGLVATAY